LRDCPPVIAGQKREARLWAIVPAIHVLLCSDQEDVDARHKAGHDEETHIQEFHS
jgi:hypothetical protein